MRLLQPIAEMAEYGLMDARTVLPILAALLPLGISAPASAQAAAETATILSATGQGTGRASRSLGSAVAGSISNAASQIRATWSDGGGGSGLGGSHPVRGGYEIAVGGDALEGTDAPTYQMSSGASIRTTGNLRRPAAAPCSQNCPESQSAPDAAPQP